MDGDMPVLDGYEAFRQIKEIEHIDTIEKDGRLYYQYKYYEQRN